MSIYVTSDEVAEALADGRPVVALEVNLVAHALPHPENLTAAAEVAGAVGDAGAVPAFVAVIDGHIKVGLTDTELERLATADRVEKVSQRDVGAVLASGALGATTVAVTMMAAAHVAVRTMVTGGIGGVHRGYVDSHDVSADLTALASSPVAVVCSGAKSILDIGRTLEALETLGVPVLAWQTDEFPAYETRSSGFKAPRRVDDLDTLAATLNYHWASGLRSGVVVANPVPLEHEADPAAVAEAIDRGLAAATEAGVTGKRITPFVLEQISAATGGDSVRAAVALTIANASLAADVAAAFNS